jgi:Helix-loop-helix DNA-binding domain
VVTSPSTTHATNHCLYEKPQYHIIRKTMPRPQLPPTPASSTDIAAKKDDGAISSSLESAFALPPPALIAEQISRASSASTSSASASNSSYHPVSPTSPSQKGQNQNAMSRRRQSNPPSIQGVEFTLPPPPSRSRKIIQVKPKPQEQLPERVENAQSRPGVKAQGTTSQQGGNKKKQPSATSVAGRKIARKTAHSLIERRRRSKMNEEFGVLKQMIPACKDQEMHKLAILQVRSPRFASISTLTLQNMKEKYLLTICDFRLQ